jgi:predicted PurR-regulated permease PerM
LANQFLTGIGAKIVSFSTSLASQLPDLVLSLFIFCCALYLFLAEGRKIRELLAENQLLPSLELDRLIPSIQTSCYATLVGSILVGGVQGLSVGVGSFVLGSKHVFLIALFTFVSSFIPVLGAAPVALFLGFVSLVKGNYVIATGYVIVAVFSGTIDNIIRPWLVRGEQNIHSLVMLFAIIGGIVLLGLPGLFLGPMFISVAFDIFSLYVFLPQKLAATIEQDF